MKDFRGHEGARICQIALVTAIVLVLQSAAASSSSNQCQVQWKSVLRTYNSLDQPMKNTLVEFTGVKHTDQSSDSRRNSHQREINLEGSYGSKISGISASYRSTDTREVTVTTLRGTELTKSTTVTREFVVAPRTVVTVWQLVASIGPGRSVHFNNVEFLEGSMRPNSEGLDCRLEVAAPINNMVTVRLKHKDSGMYLYANDIKARGWQSVILQNSRESHFKLIKYPNGYYKIRTEQPLFPEYIYAYCSVDANVYFDEPGSSNKHFWRIDIANPVDGDAVTFRNVYWNQAGLSRGRENPNDFCENNDHPDKWVIEVVR